VDIRDVLTTSGLNTLTFTDPFNKLAFTSLIASRFQRTLYIDLDSTYSAYANAGLIPAQGVDIFLPEKGRFMHCFANAIADLEQGRHSLVIFDSVSSFYSLYPPEQKMGPLNRLLCILVMLLVRCGIDLHFPVLITSMLRYRNEKGWVQSPAAKRLVEMKSVVRLSAIRFEDRQAIEIQTHPFLDAGTRFDYENPITWH